MNELSIKKAQQTNRPDYMYLGRPKGDIITCICQNCTVNAIYQESIQQNKAMLGGGGAKCLISHPFPYM